MRWIKKTFCEVEVGDVIIVDPNPNKGVSSGVLGDPRFLCKAAVIYAKSREAYWFKVQNSQMTYNGREPNRYLFLDRSS